MEPISFPKATISRDNTPSCCSEGSAIASNPTSVWILCTYKNPNPKRKLINPLIAT